MPARVIFATQRNGTQAVPYGETRDDYLCACCSYNDEHRRPSQSRLRRASSPRGRAKGLRPDTSDVGVVYGTYCRGRLLSPAGNLLECRNCITNFHPLTQSIEKRTSISKSSLYVCKNRMNNIWAYTVYGEYHRFHSAPPSAQWAAAAVSIDKHPRPEYGCALPIDKRPKVHDP